MSTWVKSSYSADSNCVEAMRSCQSGECITVRDSNNPAKTITFSDADWDAFVRGVKDGEFDLQRLPVSDRA